MRERERRRAKNALLVNLVASHAHMLVHMRPKIVISWDITRRPTPSHRTCFIPGAAINHAVFNKLQRVRSRNNTHIRREFTRARIERECWARLDDTCVFCFFYYAFGVVLFFSVLIIIYHSHARTAYCVSKGLTGWTGRGEQWITSPTVLMHFFTMIAIGESIIATQRVFVCVQI